jgi:3-phenylpropionate/trans-cinnamate dioxygenase ferredoxin reductase subunit
MLIIGGGLAAAKAAAALRDEGFDGRVLVVGDEAELPYERPPLSKSVLRGEEPEDSTRVHDAAFYADRGIEVRTSTTVAHLDADRRVVELEGGERLTFDAALLATGAAPRRLSIPGADLEGVHYLRTLADARSLRPALSGRVGIIGAGWIGTEVAASARMLGAEITVIDPNPLPLQRVLGPELGAVFADLHADHGVDLRLGTGVSRLCGSERVEAIETDGGERIEVDSVVVGVGATPRVGLAERAGLAVEGGVATDEFLRTSAPSVFAAGDVASAYHPHYGRRIRVEHWSAALNQGPLAVRNMLGGAEAYARLPYFFSDQYDLGLEYIGWARTWDQVAFRGDLAGRRFIGFYLSGGRVVAAIAVNTWDVIEPLRHLIESRSKVSTAALGDQSVDIDALVTDPDAEP